MQKHHFARARSIHELLVGTVRSRKSGYHANRDKSMKLCTIDQCRLLIKLFKGDTSLRSRDCWRQHFFAKFFFALKLKVLYIIRKEILHWSIFLFEATSENVLSSSNTCSKSQNWRHQFLPKFFLPRNLKCYISLKRKFCGNFE